jgi:hypothetical protein
MESADLLLKLDAITDQLRILTSLVQELSTKLDRVEGRLQTGQQAGGSPPG